MNVAPESSMQSGARNAYMSLLTITLQNLCTDILLFPAVHLQNIIQSLSEGFDWTGRELKCNHNRLYSSWA